MQKKRGQGQSVTIMVVVGLIGPNCKHLNASSQGWLFVLHHASSHNDKEQSVSHNGICVAKFGR